MKSTLGFCPLKVTDNFESSAFFRVIKASVAADVIATCGRCLKYARCQPEFTYLPKSGAYIVETLSSELGGSLVEV